MAFMIWGRSVVGVVVVGCGVSDSGVSGGGDGNGYGCSDGISVGGITSDVCAGVFA